MVSDADIIRIGRSTINDEDHAKLRLFLDRVSEMATEAGILSYVIAAEWDVSHAEGTCVHTNGFMSSSRHPRESGYHAELCAVAEKLAKGIDAALNKMAHSVDVVEV